MDIRKFSLKKVFEVLGPGLITAAMVLGPGTLTVCSKAGATMQYSTLWVIVVSVFFMIYFTRMAARVGCISSKSLLSIVEQNYGRTLSILMGLSVCFSCAGFQTGNTVGIGLSMDTLFGGGIAIWAVLFLVVTLAFIWTSSNFYNLLEKVMVFLVILMIVAFAGNLFRARIDGVELLKGFIPSVPSDVSILIAIASTSFSVAAAAGQVYMVQGKNWHLEDLKKGLRDAVVGIVTLGTLSAIIIVTSAAVLAPKGIQVNSAIDMALQLEPLLGPLAKWLFLIGLFAASFSSYVANAVMSGIFLADALHLGQSVNDKWVKVFASVVLALSTLVAVFFDSNPIQLIIFAQAMTVLGAPLVAVVLCFLSNNKRIMGVHKNSLSENIILNMATIWVIFLSAKQLLSLV